MRIKSWVVLVALLALVVGMSVSQFAIVQASADDTDISVGAFGASFPLWKTVTSDVSAGKSYDVEFHRYGPSEHPDENPSPITGYYKSGFLEIPVSRYSVTDATTWMAVKPRVLGIEDKYLKSLDVRVGDGYGETVKWDGARFWFNITTLHNDEGMLHEIVIDLVQNQSRQDDRGLIPCFLQIFGRKTHRQITKSERMVASFGTYDVSDELQSICKGQFGTSVEDVTKDSEQVSVLRSCVYWPLVQTIRVDGASLDYNLKAQSLAVVSQRFTPPMARQQGPSPELEKYQAQVASLTLEIQKLREQLLAPKLEIVPATPPTPVNPPAKELLMEKYAGRTGCVFYTETPGATMSWWLKSTSGAWVRVKVTNPVTREVTDNLTIGPGKERCWFYDSAKLTGDGWTGFGLGTGDAEPTTTLPLDSSLYILEVK